MIKALRPLSLAGLALALAGCAQEPVEPSHHDYTLRHPIGVESRTAIMTIERSGTRIGSEDRERIARFAGAFLNQGSGRVEVMVAAEDGFDGPALLYGQTLSEVLMAHGLSDGDLDVKLAVGAGDLGPNGVLLRFVEYVAVPPNCPDWSGNLDSPHANASDSNLGCSLQNNLSRMIADPRDLVRPRVASPRPATRPATSISRYNKMDPIQSQDAPKPDITRE